MRVQIKDMTTQQLDWAISAIDPRCKGLEWDVMSNTVVGFVPEDLKSNANVVVFLSKGYFMEDTTFKRVYANSQRYSVSTIWQQGGLFLNEWKMAISWAGDVCMASFIENGKQYIGMGIDVLSASIRAKLSFLHGDYMDIPDNIYEATKA